MGTAANIDVTVQVNPDNSTWIKDSTIPVSVAENETVFIPITHCSKYYRLSATGTEAADSKFKCWYQAQH